MSTLIEISPSPGAHPVPSHPSAQWARSPDACMTPTTLPSGLVRMGDPMSLTPSPGSSSSSAAVGTLPYAIVMSGPDHPLSDGSEHGFSSMGSRPASGSGQEQDEAGGDDGHSENNIHEPVQQTSSPLDDLERANVLHAFNFSRITTEQLAEQRPAFASPSPSSLATHRTTSRPRVAGPGRTQHPLDPIPGAPPPALQKAKGPWHKAEDAALMYWVSHLGTGKWVDIARRVGSRTGKQCRERWTNQLSPDIDHSAFRHEEDLIIITMQQTLQANKWCEVAKFLPGRPENAIKNRWNSRDLQRKRSELQLSVSSNEINLHGRVFEGTSNLKRVRDDGSAAPDEYPTFTFASSQAIHQAPKRARGASGSQRSVSSTPAARSSDIRAPDQWASEWVGGHSSTPPATMQRPYEFTGGGPYYSTPMQSPSYLLDSTSTSANAVVSHTASDPRATPNYSVTNYEEVSTPTAYAHSFYTSGEHANSQSYYATYPSTSESFGVGFSPSGTVVSNSRTGEGRNYGQCFEPPNSTHTSNARYLPALLHQRSHYIPRPPATGIDLSTVIRPSTHALQLHTSPETPHLLPPSVFSEISLARADHSNVIELQKSAQPAPSDDNSLDPSWPLTNHHQSGLKGDPNLSYPN